MRISSKTKIKSTHSNISHNDKCALEALSEDDEFVVKKADKGRAVVVWDMDLYVNEAHSQHSQKTEFYEPLTYNPTDALKRELKKCTHRFIRKYMDYMNFSN